MLFSSGQYELTWLAEIISFAHSRCFSFFADHLLCRGRNFYLIILYFLFLSLRFFPIYPAATYSVLLFPASLQHCQSPSNPTARFSKGLCSPLQPIPTYLTVLYFAYFIPLLANYTSTGSDFDPFFPPRSRMWGLLCSSFTSWGPRSRVRVL